MKRCTKCGELKEDSFFSEGRNKCKGCEKQYNKKYYQDHREERNQYCKQYSQDHKEEIKQRKKQYYQEHKEKMNQHGKQYRIKHKERLRKIYKQYGMNHKEERKQNSKKYFQSEAGKESNRKRYSKKRNMKHIPLTNNPFSEDIVVEDHHILNNLHAIDAEGSWNKWFVIPMPKITHNFVRGKTNNLGHWRHNEEWIRKLYCIDINELFGFVGDDN